MAASPMQEPRYRDMEEGWERGPIPGYGTTWPCHPGYTPPPTSWLPLPVFPGSEQKSAMGSKWTSRNSQKTLEVNPTETIWLLAPILDPCCKNQPSLKAQLTYVYPIHVAFCQDSDHYPNEKCS